MVPRMLCMAALLLLALGSAAAGPTGACARAPAGPVADHATLELAGTPESCACAVRSLDQAGAADHGGSVQRERGVAGGSFAARAHTAQPDRECLQRIVSRPLTIHLSPLPPPTL